MVYHDTCTDDIAARRRDQSGVVTSPPGAAVSQRGTLRRHATTGSESGVRESLIGRTNRTLRGGDIHGSPPALETAPTDTDNAVLIAAVIGDTFADY